MPVFFAIGPGTCFSHTHFAWGSADDKITTIGIAPGTAEGWQFGRDSLDNANHFISIIGESFLADAGGRLLPFHFAFVLKDPQYQTVTIGRDQTLRFDLDEGLGGSEPSFAPGDIKYLGPLQGDANASGYVNGVDLLYIISSLLGKRHTPGKHCGG